MALQRTGRAFEKSVFLAPCVCQLALGAGRSIEPNRASTPRGRVNGHASGYCPARDRAFDHDVLHASSVTQAAPNPGSAGFSNQHAAAYRSTSLHTSGDVFALAGALRCLALSIAAPF